jgi:hypothetical protein
MFTYPTPEFFALAGNVLAPVLFAAFALATIFLSRRSPIATPLVLTVLLPVVFTLALFVVTVISHGPQVLSSDSNFDNYTTGRALREFSMIAGYLSALAVLGGWFSARLVANARRREEADG